MSSESRGGVCVTLDASYTLPHRTRPPTAVRWRCSGPARRCCRAVPDCSEPSMRPGSSRQAEQAAEVAFERSTELEPRAVVQKHDVLAMTHRLELLDAVNIHDRLAMDAHE